MKSWKKKFKPYWYMFGIASGMILGIMHIIFLGFFKKIVPLIGCILVIVEISLILLIKRWWKKLKFWQIFGITFGVIYIILQCFAFQCKGEGCGYGTIIIEMPFLIISSVIEKIFNFSLEHYLWNKFGNYSEFITGTIVYMAIGSLIGWLIDIICMDFVKRRK